MDENTKASTGGSLTTPEPGKPLETGPGENGGQKRLHSTGQQGAMAVVEIEHHDPDYKPSEAWLASQRRQQLAAGGRFTSQLNEERKREILDEIRSFTYDRYTSPGRAAARWGVSVPYARSICAEAHKLAREELEDEDYAKATLLEALGKVVRDNIHKPGVGNQQLVVKAAKVYSEIAGVNAPVQLKLSRGKDDLPDDPAELLQLVEDFKRRHMGGMPVELALGGGAEDETPADSPGQRAPVGSEE